MTVMKKTILSLLALAAAVGAGAQGTTQGGAQSSGSGLHYEQGRASVKEWNATRRGWEVGVGGSVWQFNRVPYIKFTPGETSHTVDIKLRHAAYTGQLYAARELSNVFAVDLNGGLGKLENRWLAHAGVGLQWRLGHYFRSPWIDPYLRLGVGYLYNGYDTSYQGEEEGVSYEWWNVGNKEGGNTRSAVPVSAGVGVNMWLSNRFGIGLEGDYNYIIANNVANPLQGTVRLLWRFGGRDRRPAPRVAYVDRPVERIVERVVEKVIEKPGTSTVVERVVNLNELLSSIYFDYNRADIKPEFSKTLEDVAGLLKKDTADRYLLSGFTDSHGSAEYNLRLSERRVNAIRDALVQRGVPASMLKTRGQGKRIANLPTSASETARMGDRKVTIELINNSDYWNAL
jgi:outer membrane protein OmpA-like peptidoglycan-associated protein